ncbi:uncharacterized protein LOC143299880 [Babylonia areolata]|uniref:uncharacterized protein LOC143299880 n=1 Tax=Babylonia areolata TaxID=304850 RepID=UPI003FD0CFE3
MRYRMKGFLKDKWVICVAGVCAFMVLYLLYSTPWSSQKVVSSPPEFETYVRRFSGDYDVWPAYQAPANEQLEQAWFQKTCLPSKMELSIENLSEVLSHWGMSSNKECRELLVKFRTLYKVSTRNASVILPKPFQEKVRKWLGYNKDLFQEVYHQDIIHVINYFTREHTIFNPLRDKRPVSPPDQPEAKYFDQLIQNTAPTCDFCRFKDYTAEHTFLRVENEHAFSASNTFKMDTLHALLAMKQHDPLRWSPETFMGLMDLTLTWFHKAHKSFPSARFPSVIWDVLPKCGASQVHPHLHGFLDPERYHGVVESWRRGAQDYYSISGANFYTDMANVSATLGLAVTHRSATAFASLVPRKDHEVVIMAPAANNDFFEMVYFVLRAFVEDQGKYCFSMGMAYPALEGEEAVIPAYARVITRGVVTDIRADMSSLELFTATNVNIDPFKVAKLIKKSAEERRSKFR